MDRKPNDDRRKIESPLENKPGVVKPSNAKKFFGGFMASDLDDVKDYILFNVIQPRAKTLLVDTLHRAAEMMIMGTTNGYNNSSRNPSRESYTRYYYDREPAGRPQPRQQNMMYAPYNDPLFDTEDDVWKVIDEMTDYVEEYPTLSISEFLSFCKRPEDDEYTFQYYGWTAAQINSARPEQLNNGGWVIKLPKPKYIR